MTSLNRLGEGEVAGDGVEAGEEVAGFGEEVLEVGFDDAEAFGFGGGAKEVEAGAVVHPGTGGDLEGDACFAVVERVGRLVAGDGDEELAVQGVDAGGEVVVPVGFLVFVGPGVGGVVEVEAHAVEHFDASASFDEQIDHALVVFLENFGNAHGGGVGGGAVVLFVLDDEVAAGIGFGPAMRDHFPVAGLEYVQGGDLPGQDHHGEGEKGKAFWSFGHGVFLCDYTSGTAVCNGRGRHGWVRRLNFFGDPL